MKIAEWIKNETCIETVEHPTAEAWVEIHENPDTGERIYLAIDTSGCDGGLIGGKVYTNFADANNAVGEQEGFSDLWRRID